MTHADILTAARSNIVGPYVPAKPEWLAGWCGPVEWLDTFRDPAGVWTIGAYGAGGMANGLPAERLRLDLRRPEVRDRLVRCGAPEWARDIPAALWVWVTSGKVPRRALPAWVQFGKHHVRGRSGPSSIASVCDLEGWAHREDSGPETGPEGMACADVAALRAGCILAEPDGWLVPLPDGGIGFWPREAP